MSDTFRRGGDLVDVDTWYAGRDKVQHAVCGFVLAVGLRRVGCSRLWALGLVLLGAILWEVFEQIRYRRWTLGPDGIRAPRPPFCDIFSWRDVVASLGGAVLGMP